MKKLALISAIAASAILSGVAQAACNGTTTCSGKISRLYINQSGTLFIRLADTDIPSGSSCTSSGNYAQLAPTNASFKNFYAMALTSQASDADLSIRIVDSSPTCEVQYLVIDTPS